MAVTTPKSRPTAQGQGTKRAGAAATIPTAQPSSHSDAAPENTAGPQKPRVLHDESRSELDKTSVFWLVVLHVALVVSPFFFSWQALVVTLVLHWLTGGIGICLGYHRYFTHAGFETYRPVRWIIALLGGLSGEGSAATWVANHRKHHAHSDQHGDPHSPLDGAWWSHMFWLAWQYPEDVQEKHLDKWAPDIKNDAALQWIADKSFVWQVMLGAGLCAAGYALGGLPMAASFLVWGMFVRLCFVLHATWFVNSASHIWGYRNYKTTDESRNNWWVALITYGEGWHNNHHAYPRMAAHGHRWWELDVTFWTIRALQAVGLVWNVVDYKRAADKQAAH